jgi:hypothetical protein
MKKLIYILSLAAVASLTVLSCQKEQEVNPRTPSPAEVAGCYGVYFPVQEASGDHVFNPTQDPELEITVARTNDSGAITVPVKASYSEDGIFVPQEIKFADGQKETTIKVRFDNAKEGVNYKASFLIEDGQYASLYNSNPVSIDFSVMRVEMKYLLDPKTGEKAVVTFTQDFWGETAWGYVKYYEVDGVRTCFTETFLHEYKGDQYDDPGFWGYGSEYEWTFTWYPKEAHPEVEGAQMISFPFQATGYVHSELGMIYTGDEIAIRNAILGTSYDWMANARAGNFTVSYYDGNGGFYFAPWYYLGMSGSGWGQSGYETIGIASGFTRTDFSLKDIQNDFTEEGVLPLAFVTGVDVTKVAFVLAAGEITATQVGNQVTAIATGTAENVYVLDDELEETTYMDEPVLVAITGVTLEETGVYTVVAVTYDDKGEVADYGSLVVNYVAAGDEEEMAVELACGIGSAAKYPGVNTDNTLEVWVYGSDIVDLKMAAVKYIDLASKPMDVVEALMDSPSVSAEILEQVNTDGYVGLAEKLLPGTEYYLVVLASNGYEEKVFCSPESFFTTGDPLPIYLDYTTADYYADGAFANREAAIGTWNYYAVDWYGSLGLREYLGKVNITASPSETEGPDSSGLYDEYVLVDGLFPNAVVDGPEYGYEVGDGILEMDVYGGLLYSCSKTTYDGKSDIHTYSGTLGGWYTATYYSAFIPVAEGYYAFMDVSGQGYDFRGLRIVKDYVWDAFLDMLLVDPAKDDNGMAPSSAQISAAKNRVREIAESTKNFVETPKGRIQSVIDQYKKSVKVYGNIVPVEGTCPVRTVKAELSNTNRIPAAQGREKGFLQAPTTVVK